MWKQKYFFEECPKQQCKELDDQAFEEIKAFYNDSYKSSCVYRKIFDVACSVDKTLLTFIAGILTSFSINLATSFIKLEEIYSGSEFIFHILQFAFTVGFSIYTIRFAAKVINIQECGEKYFPSQKISKELINKAQKNVMFYACMNNENYLKKFIFRGGMCITIVIVSMIFRSICVKSINQIILFLGNSWNNIKEFLGV